MLGFKVLALLRTTLSFQTYTRGVSRILTKITNCVFIISFARSCHKIILFKRFVSMSIKR